MQVTGLSISLLALTLIAGCASKPPSSIDKLPADNPSLNRVRMDIDSHVGREVRWGGVISEVENKPDRTWVQVVRYPLRDSGRPREGGLSDGRFIASFGRFLDPVVYEIGRPITVVGTIEDKTRRPIGEHEYLFPIVAVEGSHLWSTHSEIHQPYYPPWWYYDPWYPFPPHHHHPWHHH